MRILKKIFHFIRSLYIFVQMYGLGFNFDGNIHRRKDGGLWCFYRFIYRKKDDSVCTIFDVDFENRIYKGGKGDLEYFHARGDDVMMSYNYKHRREDINVKK